MNKERAKRLARDLANMTPVEAMATMQIMTQQHGRAVARAAADSLLTAAKSPKVLEHPWPRRVLLHNSMPKKIMVIKTIREFYNMELKRAKELADRAVNETVVLEEPTRGSIYELAQRLRDTGATVELK